jgi:hypothetical protein
MLRLPGLTVCNSDILHQGLLVPSFFQWNTKIDDPFRSGYLAAVAKTHLLVVFALFKNYIREFI